ncbi:MAG: hypothetical protein QW478_00545, partial [Candidatus Micrarchaeaceae archaeon]
SDIFRLCYLYLYGGCYFDCKLINKTPIREFIDPNDEVILCEDRIFYSHKGYYNAIIFSISKKDILLNGINRTVNNILNKSYKFSDIFGPHVLYDVANNQNVNIKFKFIFPKVIEIKTNKILVSGFNNDYYKKYKDSGYINLWKEKNLYYDIIYLDNYLIKIYPTNHKFIFYKKNNILIVKLINGNKWNYNLNVILIDNNTNSEKQINVGPSCENMKIVVI